MAHEGIYYPKEAPETPYPPDLLNILNVVEQYRQTIQRAQSPLPVHNKSLSEMNPTEVLVALNEEAVARTPYWSLIPNAFPYTFFSCLAIQSAPPPWKNIDHKLDNPDLKMYMLHDLFSRSVRTARHLLANEEEIEVVLYGFNMQKNRSIPEVAHIPIVGISKKPSPFEYNNISRIIPDDAELFQHNTLCREPIKQAAQTIQASFPDLLDPNLLVVTNGASAYVPFGIDNEELETAIRLPELMVFTHRILHEIAKSYVDYNQQCLAFGIRIDRNNHPILGMQFASKFGLRAAGVLETFNISVKHSKTSFTQEEQQRFMNNSRRMGEYFTSEPVSYLESPRAPHLLAV